MHEVRWLFFDLGNTLISEEEAWERRLQLLVEALERQGRPCAIDEARAALVAASAEFAPRIIVRAIEKLVDDDECRRVVLQAARYQKAWRRHTQPPDRCFVPCPHHTRLVSSQTNPSARRSGLRGGD